MSTPSISVLDVGQGSCTVILSQPQVGVVDCPPGGAAKAAAYIDQEFGPGPLSMMIGSHRDLDHIGGFPDLLATRGAEVVVLNRSYALPGRPEDLAKVRTVLRAIYSHIDQHGVHYRELVRGQELHLGTATIRCLWPDQTAINLGTLGTDTNSACMVLKVESDGSTCLLPGDMVNGKIWRRLVAEEDLKVDVLVLPHHGGHVTALRSLLEATDPSTAVLSFGRGNAYGHPLKRTLESLANHTESRIMCTEVARACHGGALGAAACAGTVRFQGKAKVGIHPEVAEHSKVIDTLDSPVCRTRSVPPLD